MEEQEQDWQWANTNLVGKPIDLDDAHAYYNQYETWRCTDCNTENKTTEPICVKCGVARQKVFKRNIVDSKKYCVFRVLKGIDTIAELKHEMEYINLNARQYMWSSGDKSLDEVCRVLDEAVGIMRSYVKVHGGK